MKSNKKWLVLLPILIAVIVFICLYFYYNKPDKNALTVNDKKWIKSNISTVIDVEVPSNYPVYGNDGLFYNFIDDFQDDTGLELNVVPYLKTSKPSTKKIRFQALNSDVKLSDKDFLVSEDVYIAVSKAEFKINRVTDFKDMTLGVLTDDVGEISYYLKNGTNVTYKPFDEIDTLLESLNDGKVDLVIIPNIMYLDKTIANDEYNINYTLTEMNKKLVFTVDSDDEKLNSILSKYYKNWKNKKYVDVYNENLLKYYITSNNINDKTKADLLSKNYVYGYVENKPYETVIDGSLVGIAGEYINRIQRLTSIDFTFKKYKNISELEKAIAKGQVDIYFNYYNIDNNKYKATTSTFVEEYVVLSTTNDSNVVNSFEALKGKDVAIMKDNALYDYFKDNSKANIATYKNLNELLEKNKKSIIILDKELYTIYKNSKLKGYEVLYSGIMTNDYKFMVKTNNDTFYDLFNYIINTNSYYRYRNNGLNSLNISIFERTTFEQLYILILALIFTPIIVLTILYFLIKRKKKVKVVRKEERRKYADMLTSLKNRNYLNLNIKTWNESKKYPKTVVIVDLNNVKYVNDNYGHEAGDNLIVDAASILVNTQLENSEIVRTDGNEFLIYLVGYSEPQVSTYTKKLAKELKSLPYKFGAALGYSIIKDEIKTIDDAINEATLEMRTDKEDYK